MNKNSEQKGVDFKKIIEENGLNPDFRFGQILFNNVLKYRNGDTQIFIEDPFYEIEYFEVYCFCPILLIENKNSNYYNINDNYRKNITIKDTDYFLVGGLDLEKREGKIKLFKIIYGNKACETKIEFLQDIEIDDENFEEFDGPISCITQSRITGNILITCYNGNVYLFTQPNIQYYLDNNYN